MEKTVVLDNKKTEQIIKRIAYQLYEDFIDEDEIAMVGIKDNGFLFAELLAKELNSLSTKNNTVLLAYIEIDKVNPTGNEMKLSIDKELLKEKNVIIVDDVLNSGNTLMHVASFVMKENVKLMRTVSLVDRRHRKFPIRADYVGLTLSTTVKEHIEVEFNNSKIAAYLI